MYQVYTCTARETLTYYELRVRTGTKSDRSGILAAHASSVNHPSGHARPSSVFLTSINRLFEQVETTSIFQARQET